MSTLPLRLLLREVVARGLDAAPALAVAELGREVVEDMRHHVPWAQCRQLTAAFHALSHDDTLGVHAGARAVLSDLELPGLYLRMQDDAGAAARFHRDNRDVFEASGMFDIGFTPDTVVISLLRGAGDAVHGVFSDCLLAASLTLAEAVIGPFDPVAVQLRRSRPGDDCAYRRILGAKLEFDTARDALMIPRAAVERPMPYRDSVARSVLRPHVDQQIQAIRGARADLATRAALVVREELAGGLLSVQKVAKRLQVSPRSLRRGLQQGGTSYSALISHVRSELAQQYARAEPQRSGAEIGSLLGYQDAHAFYRAFQRWTGMTLSAYREQTTQARSARPLRG